MHVGQTERNSFRSGCSRTGRGVPSTWILLVPRLPIYPQEKWPFQLPIFMSLEFVDLQYRKSFELLGKFE